MGSNPWLVTWCVVKNDFYHCLIVVFVHRTDYGFYTHTVCVSVRFVYLKSPWNCVKVNRARVQGEGRVCTSADQLVKSAWSTFLWLSLLMENPGSNLLLNLPHLLGYYVRDICRYRLLTDANCLGDL